MTHLNLHNAMTHNVLHFMDSVNVLHLGNSSRSENGFLKNGNFFALKDHCYTEAG